MRGCLGITAAPFNRPRSPPRLSLSASPRQDSADNSAYAFLPEGHDQFPARRMGGDHRLDRYIHDLHTMMIASGI